MTSRIDLKPFQERDATTQDEQWLWRLYAELFRPIVEKQWGWVEDVQQHNFRTYLPANLFRIVSYQQSDIAAYAIEEHSDKLYLHMLLVTKEVQLNGIGSGIINQLKQQAQRKQLPIELSVIAANPASAFYEKNGFTLVEQTQDNLRYRCENSNDHQPKSKYL